MKTFKTDVELLLDEKCLDFIQTAVREIRSKRSDTLREANDPFDSNGRSRMNYYQNAKLKANAFSTLEKMNSLAPAMLTSHYLLIINKQSKLAYREREWVYGLVRNCMLQTIVYYNQLEKETNKIKS